MAPFEYNIEATVDLFAFSDFISPAVIQYLGVYSPTCFGSTHKAVQNTVVSIENLRRKDVIAAYEVEIKDLMMDFDPEAIVPRANVLWARQLADGTLSLIDNDEAKIHRKYARINRALDTLPGGVRVTMKLDFNLIRSLCMIHFVRRGKSSYLTLPLDQSRLGRFTYFLTASTFHPNTRHVNSPKVKLLALDVFQRESGMARTK